MKVKSGVSLQCARSIPVHTSHYSRLEKPTIYSDCHLSKTTAYILHVVFNTTHTHDRRKSIGEKKHRKKNKIKERKEEIRKRNKTSNERKRRQKRKSRKDKTRRESKPRKKEEKKEKRRKERKMSYYQTLGTG